MAARFIRTPTGIIGYDNNFSDEQKNKLQYIEYGAQVNTILGVKGSNESKYRIGYIEITKDNVGLGSVDNTPDIEKNVNSAKKLTTGRDITIGNKTVNFDGTKNIAYTLLEIGAVNRAGDTITGDLSINGATTLGSTLTVDGAVTLNDILKVINSVTLSSTLNVGGATTINGASVLKSTLTVDGSTTLNDILKVVKATTLGSTLTVDGAVTLNDILKVAKAAALDSTLNVAGSTTLATLTVDGVTTFNNSVTGTTIVATTGFTGELTGNAATATKLKTARTINGTSFDGSSDITTTKWGTTRTISMGITSKNFDGGSNIGWSLAEIGALPLTGGTMTGDIGIPIAKASIDGSVPYAGSLGSVTAATGMNAYKTYLGSVTISSVWYNMISIRHRNGNGDGSNYGMVLYSALTSSGSLAWNKQTGSNSWQGERIILDSSNYTSYTVTKTGSGASGTWGISVSGSAGSVAWENVVGRPDSYNPSGHTHNYAGSTSAGGPANSLAGFTNTTTSGTAVDNATQNGHVYVTETSGIFSQNDGAAFVQAYSTSWVAQIYQDYRTGQIALRGKNNGVWQAWRKVLDSSNYTDYTVTKTGSGASGTWGISVSGNAATATKLATARTITLSGSVTGSASFDGSGNITISTSTNHNHNYLPLSGGTMTGNIAFSAVTSTSYPAKSNKITWSGSTDGAEIYYQVDASDAGRLVLNLTDDTDTRICFALNGSVKSYIDANGNFSANAATASKLATARTITLSGSVTGSGTFDGSGNLSISTTTNHTHNYAGSSSAGGAATTALTCTGNSATATKLATARTITLSGSVTGSASFDGSGNITISTSTNHSHSYLPLSGGTLTGAVTCNSTITFGQNNNYGIFTSTNNYCGIGTDSKRFAYSYIVCMHGGSLVLTSNNRSTSTTYNGTLYCGTLTGSRSYTLPDKTGTIAMTSDLTWNNISGTPSSYTPASHTHSYLPLSGGTLTGAVTCNSTITFGKNDSYGIRITDNNYCTIGEYDKRFFKSYINYMNTVQMNLYTSGYDTSEQGYITYNSNSTTMYNSSGTTINDTVGLDIYSYSNLRLYATKSNSRIYLCAYSSICCNAPIVVNSDEKVKTFTDDIDNDKDKLIKLFDIIKLKSYKYRYNNSRSLILGFSAQDIESACIELDIDPEKYGILNIEYNSMISRGDSIEDYKFYTKFYNISYNDLYNLSLLKIKNLEDIENEHSSKLNELEERIALLEGK